MNVTYMTLVRETALRDGNRALWAFNLDRQTLDRLLALSLQEVNELADCGRMFAVLPDTLMAKTQGTSRVSPALMAALSRPGKQVA